MSRIIAVANVKGGVGKTTTTNNLAAALTELGRKVLAVDLDPQASLTVSASPRSAHFSRTLSHALSSSAAPLSSLIVQTGAHFDLVPANHDLRQTEHELEKRGIRLYAVRDALEPVCLQYDYILLDCPANAGILTANALASADQVVIPFQSDYLALQALDWFLEIVKEMHAKIAPRLRVAGLFLAMHDPTLSHASEIISEARKRYCEVPFFSAVVNYTILMKQAGQRGESILQFAPDSQAAEAYRLLAHEIEEGIKEGAAEDVYAVLQQGRAALARQERSRAYDCFCKATQLDPQLAEGWRGRAQSSSEWDEAVRGYGQALILEPTRTEARSQLEMILNEHLDSAGPSNVSQLMAVGHYLLRAGFRPYAEHAYRRVTELNAALEEAWLGGARATGNPQEAVRYLRHALELNPANTQARDGMQLAVQRLNAHAASLVDEGQTLMHSGFSAQAHQLFKQATELDPNNVRAWTGCARTSEDLESALQALGNALRISPVDAEARELHSWLWKPENDSGESEGRPRWSSLTLAAIFILASLAALAMLYALGLLPPFLVP